MESDAFLAGFDGAGFDDAGFSSSPKLMLEAAGWCVLPTPCLDGWSSWAKTEDCEGCGFLVVFWTGVSSPKLIDDDDGWAFASSFGTDYSTCGVTVSGTASSVVCFISSSGLISTGGVTSIVVASATTSTFSSSCWISVGY